MATARWDYPAEEFTLRLRERLPMNICFTFTSDQLEALRRVFGDRLDGRHSLDMRGRVHLPWSRYYIVFQAGRDRRRSLRRQGATRFGRIVLDSAICFAPVVGVAAGAAWLAAHFFW